DRQGLRLLPPKRVRIAVHRQCDAAMAGQRLRGLGGPLGKVMGVAFRAEVWGRRGRQFTASSFVRRESLAGRSRRTASKSRSPGLSSSPRVPGSFLLRGRNHDSATLTPRVAAADINVSTGHGPINDLAEQTCFQLLLRAAEK